MEVPLEYCVLRFFLQWERREKLLHNIMKKSPSLDDIRESLSYFQVARNFPRLNIGGRAQWIADSLAEVGADRNLSPQKKVDLLARKFNEKFRQFNLSAASKLFWLRYRRPYIIMDSRAIRALQKIERQIIDKKDYAGFCKVWRKAYLDKQEEIRSASRKLVRLHDFFPAWHKNANSLARLLDQRWFRERVFDIYLWELGGSD